MKTSATPSATARARLGLIVSMTVFGNVYCMYFFLAQHDIA